jgi:hypothetical protein
MGKQVKSKSTKIENCAICGCLLNRNGKYASPTTEGRSHASEHHFVAERFFGRSGNGNKEIRLKIFEKCPWELKGKSEVLCYECHEILLHNPVFTREDIAGFAELVKLKKLDEPTKTDSCEKLAMRIQLLHEVIENGIKILKNEMVARHGFEP